VEWYGKNSDDHSFTAPAFMFHEARSLTGH
jgi:hypothetical protein